ncbi:unnamed protein product [Brassica oleracea var. botrytis]
MSTTAVKPSALKRFGTHHWDPRKDSKKSKKLKETTTIARVTAMNNNLHQLLLNAA